MQTCLKKTFKRGRRSDHQACQWGEVGKLSSYVPNERGGRRFSFSKSSMQREVFVHVQLVADEEVV